MPNPIETRVPIRSTWRTAVGKKLTNAIIARYEALCYYGEAKANSHIVHRCRECDSKKHVVYYKFKYLPEKGFYCLGCFRKHQARHHAEQEEKENRLAQLLAEYV